MPKQTVIQHDMFEDQNPKSASHTQTSQSVYSEVSKSLIPLSLGGSSRHAHTTEDTNFVLSRRWENCADQASKRDNYFGLLNIVRPVIHAQDQLIDYLKLMRTTKEGALWVFYGQSGSGKTTFLSSLEHQFNKDKKIIESKVIKADDLSISNRVEFRKNLIDIINNRASHEITLVLVLEDREDNIDDLELDSFVQTLKSILRNPNFGENTLVVFPVNSIKNGRRIVEAANGVGIQQHEGSRNTIFTFQGPEPEFYIDIVEDLTSVLNGRPLSSFGMSRTTMEGMPKDRITIGNFIQEVAERVQSQENRMNSLLRQAQYKELVTIFAFVRPLEATDLFTSTQQIVVDSYNRINPSWLLTDGSELSIREWRNAPERFASIINGLLHTRVVDFPPHVLYQLILFYGSDELKTNFANALREEGLDPTPTKNQANARNALDATNLARILRGEPVIRPNKVTLDSGVEESDLSEDTQQRRNLIRKGIFTAKWIPSLPSVNAVHGSVARAFKDLITRGNLRTQVRGYTGAWFEGTLGIEGDGKVIKTIKPDVTIETNDTLYLIEFSFGSPERLTRADMANYIMRKINDYHQQLPLLRQIKDN